MSLQRLVPLVERALEANCEGKSPSRDPQGSQPDTHEHYLRRFGSIVRSCRRARGLTQESLAELSDLSPDTIRRLEYGSFSPSLRSLLKLCAGLQLQLSTLFTAFELRELDPARAVWDWLKTLDREQLDQILLVLPLLQMFLQMTVGMNSKENEGD